MRVYINSLLKKLLGIQVTVSLTQNLEKQLSVRSGESILHCDENDSYSCAIIILTSANVNHVDVVCKSSPLILESETNRVDHISPVQRLAIKRYQSGVWFNCLALRDLISVSGQEAITEVSDSGALLRNVGFCNFTNKG